MRPQPPAAWARPVFKHALLSFARPQVRSEDVPTDAFTTEAAEEAWALYGEPASLQTAWRNTEHLTELAYTQFWCAGGGRG